MQSFISPLPLPRKCVGICGTKRRNEPRKKKRQVGKRRLGLGKNGTVSQDTVLTQRPQARLEGQEARLRGEEGAPRKPDALARMENGG